MDLRFPVFQGTEENSQNFENLNNSSQNSGEFLVCLFKFFYILTINFTRYCKSLYQNVKTYHIL